jgi:hypothetical protein
LGKMAPSVMGVISTSPEPSSYLPESPSTGELSYFCSTYCLVRIMTCPWTLI